eukprot:scaffold18196_cov111-Isochrysis_galbana.AAC.1
MNEADGPIGMIYTRQEGMKGLRPENPHDGHRSVLRLVGLAHMHEGYTHSRQIIKSISALEFD